jgi:hypothetical protein
MIEPEIALADVLDNAALAEALLKYDFAALSTNEPCTEVQPLLEWRAGIGPDRRSGSRPVWRVCDG